MQLSSRSLQEVVAALSSEEKYPEEKYDDEEMDDEQDNVEKRLSNSSNRNSKKTMITFRTKTEQARQRKGADRGDRFFLTFRQQT